MCAFSDALLQPVEHSYTIESLEAMASKCALTLSHFCQDQFSRNVRNFDWNCRFEDNKLQNLYDDLPDLKRWYITNLLQGENSPMLWFYLHKQSCPRPIKSEKEICQDFLNSKFKPTMQRHI